MKKLLYILLITLIILMGIIVISFVWFWADNYFFPLEPKSSGDFPDSALWIFEADHSILATPLSNDGRVFLRTCCSIVSLQSETGAFLWQVDSPAPTRNSKYPSVLPPKVFNDYLILPENISRIAVYSKHNGQFIWRSPEPDIFPNALDLIAIESFGTNGEQLLVARWGWKLTAYDLSNGDLLWEVPLEDRVTPFIQLDSENVYVDGEETITIYDVRNGQLKRKIDFDGFVGPILLDEDILYIATYMNSKILTSIELDSMNEKWAIYKNKISDERLWKVISSGELLYVAGKKVHAISSENGSVLWSSEQLGELETPATFNGYLAVRNKEHTLFLLDSKSGLVSGQLEIKAHPSLVIAPDRSPIFAGNILIVPFGDERVFAYKFHNEE